ncbi:MAG: hypothetical protein ACK559_26790 [bacterium]
MCTASVVSPMMFRPDAGPACARRASASSTGFNARLQASTLRVRAAGPPRPRAGRRTGEGAPGPPK